MLLTTQYLDEAEQLADRIAILHKGTIIQNGTLAELKQLLPPAKVEYVEKQPSLEDVFLALVGDTGETDTADDDRADAVRTKGTPMTTHVLGDTGVLTGRSLRHILRSPDTIITTAVTPIALMLLFVYVFGGAINTGSDESYVDYMLPGILLITIASGIAYTAYRLFLDLQGGIFERFQSMPIATVERALGARAHLAGREPGLGRDRHRRRADHGLPHRRIRGRLARGRRHPDPVHPRADLDRRDRGAVGEDRRRRERVQLPADLPAVHQLRVRAHRLDARPGRLVRREPARDRPS